MAYKHLSSQRMVTISGAWLDRSRERPLIESLPHAGALLGAVHRAHQGLLQTHRAGTKASAEAAALHAAEATAAEAHDRVARAVHALLTAFADLASDPAEAEAMTDLRDRLYPDGPEAGPACSRVEVGEAALVEGRLTPSDRALLERLPVPGGTLLDVHRARVRAARELAELEKKHASAATTPTGMPVVTSSSVARARDAWIRAVNALVATLDLEEALEDEDRKRIVGPLAEAERWAERRARGGETPRPANECGEPALCEPAQAKTG